MQQAAISLWIHQCASILWERSTIRKLTPRQNMEMRESEVQKHPATCEVRYSALQNGFAHWYIVKPIGEEKKKLYIQSRFPVFCYSGSHSCRQENAFTFVITLTTCMLVAGTPRARTPGSVFACGDYRSASGRLFNVLYKHAKCGLACGWMSDFRRTAPFDGCRDQKRQIFFYPESF